MHISTDVWLMSKAIHCLLDYVNLTLKVAAQVPNDFLVKVGELIGHGFANVMICIGVSQTSVGLSRGSGRVTAGSSRRR